MRLPNSEALSFVTTTIGIAGLSEVDPPRVQEIRPGEGRQVKLILNDLTDKA